MGLSTKTHIHQARLNIEKSTNPNIKLLQIFENFIVKNHTYLLAN